MKIRLHEIELGVQDLRSSQSFYSIILGLSSQVANPELEVYDSGIPGLDLNLSSHALPDRTVISFLTDELEEVIVRLREATIDYEGPVESHLGMRSISFRDPDGNLIKVNQAGDDSPDWLKKEPFI